jgi:hypothetical protein
MKAPRIVQMALLGLCVFSTCADDCLPNQTGSPGFPVGAEEVITDTAGNYLGGGPLAGQAVSGVWLSDGSGAAGSIYQFAGFTQADGGYMVSNGRINANWSAQIIWEPPCYDITSGSVLEYVTAYGFTFDCDLTIGEVGPDTSSTHFVLPSALPAAITSYGDFTTTFGLPQLNVYAGAAAPGLVGSVSASSVIPGSSATFPFPTQSNDSPLGEGFYYLASTNATSTGSPVFVNPSYLAIGGTATLSSAFGVDAADVTETIKVCVTVTVDGRQTTTCGSSTIYTPRQFSRSTTRVRSVMGERRSPSGASRSRSSSTDPT